MPEPYDADDLADMKLFVRTVFTAVHRASPESSVYWQAANYVLAFAIAQERGGDTYIGVTTTDERVVLAFRCGVDRLNELRREDRFPWPAFLQTMRRFHQGRITAALPKDAAGELRERLKTLLKVSGPHSFDGLLAQAAA